MLVFGHCPRCNEPIPADRQAGTMIVCQCGWSVSAHAEMKERKTSDRICLTILVTGLLLIGAFIHAVNWDRHFFTIVPLKTAQLLNIASEETLLQIAKICEERAKPVCTAEAHYDLYQLNPNNIEALAAAAKIYAQTGQVQNALAIYEKYFSLKGKSLEAAYEYAKLLGEIGNVALSRKYFEHVLKAKPHVLQITVTRAYVDMLIKNKLLKDAKQVINYWRSRGDNTRLIMDRELQEINKQLGMAS